MIRSAPTKQLGQLVAHYRHEAGLSQRGLAERTGISASDLARLELGRYRQPRMSLLAPVARALGIEVEQLTDLVPHETPPLPVYLRSKYQLPRSAAAEAEAYFQQLQRKYGVREEENHHGH